MPFIKMTGCRNDSAPRPDIETLMVSNRNAEDGLFQSPIVWKPETADVSILKVIDCYTLIEDIVFKLMIQPVLQVK